MDEENLNWPITVTLFAQEKHDGEWTPENLVDAIAWLQGFLEQVPVEYREAATIEITSERDYDWHKPYIEISYQRPPTDADKQERLAKEKQRRDKQVAERRQHYEHLKTEFGE